MSFRKELPVSSKGPCPQCGAQITHGFFNGNGLWRVGCECGWGEWVAHGDSFSGVELEDRLERGSVEEKT